MITLADILGFRERPLDDEVVGQLDLAPAAIVELDRSGTGRSTGLGVLIGVITGVRSLLCNVAALEAPPVVERQAVADSGRIGGH